MSQNTLPAAPKRSLLVILLVLITLVACGAAGYSWWQLKQHQEGAQPVAKELPRPHRCLCRWTPLPSIY